MEPIIIMQSKWGADMMVPMYLFFGGITAGIFVIAVVADLFRSRHPHLESISRIAAFAAVPCYVLAGIFITFHLGKPLRGMFFPFFFSNTSSWMTLGGWAMGIGGGFLFIYAASHLLNVNERLRTKLGGLGNLIVNDRLRLTVGIVGIPILIWLAVNTALLLAGAKFVPLWSMTYLPWLFVNSGLLTAVAGIGLIYIIYRAYLKPAGDEEAAASALKMMTYGLIIFEVIEAGILFAFFRGLLASPEGGTPVGGFIVAKGGKLAYAYVIQGDLAGWFWVGVILIGLAIPFVISLASLAIRRWEIQLSSAKFALVLAGGVILRFVIVWGGDLSAPLPFPPSSIPPMVGG